MKTGLPLSAMVLALCLACGGRSPGAPESPASPAPTAVSFSFPSPPDGLLVQTSTGLYDREGRYLAPLPGSDGIRDAAILDVSSGTFLRSDETGTARHATRSGDTISVRTVAGGGPVERPVGQVAVVSSPTAGGHRVIDAQGHTLMEGVHVASRSGCCQADPSLDQPEYWWNPGYRSLPVPLCHDRGDAPDWDRCGWLRGDGTWLAGDQWGYVTGFETGWAEGRDMSRAPQVGPTRWLDPEGASFFAASMPMPWAWTGMPTEDELLLVQPDAPSGAVPLEVVGRDGVSRGKTALGIVLEVSSGHLCTSDRSECRYRFHEQRAPVWIDSGDGFQAAYLGPDGGFAIGPVACTANHLSGPFHDGRAFLCDGDAYWMVDRDGARIAGPYPDWPTGPHENVPNHYPAGLFFSEGLAAVPVPGGWAYVDGSGTTVLPGPYDVARPFRLGMATVMRGDVVSVVRKDGSPTLLSP